MRKYLQHRKYKLLTYFHQILWLILWHIWWSPDYVMNLSQHLVSNLVSTKFVTEVTSIPPFLRAFLSIFCLEHFFEYFFERPKKILHFFEHFSVFVSYLTNILKLLSDPLDVLMQHDCDADPFLRLKVGSLSSFSSHMPVCTPKALSRQAAKLWSPLLWSRGDCIA